MPRTTFIKGPPSDRLGAIASGLRQEQRAPRVTERPAPVEVSAQELTGRIRVRHGSPEPVLGHLGADAQHPVRRVDIVRAQRADFFSPQPTVVGQRQHEPIPYWLPASSVKDADPLLVCRDPWQRGEARNEAAFARRRMPFPACSARAQRDSSRATLLPRGSRRRGERRPDAVASWSLPSPRPSPWPRHFPRGDEVASSGLARSGRCLPWRPHWGRRRLGRRRQGSRPVRARKPRPYAGRARDRAQSLTMRPRGTFAITGQRCSGHPSCSVSAMSTPSTASTEKGSPAPPPKRVPTTTRFQVTYR